MLIDEKVPREEMQIETWATVQVPRAVSATAQAAGAAATTLSNTIQAEQAHRESSTSNGIERRPSATTHLT